MFCLSETFSYAYRSNVSCLPASQRCISLLSKPRQRHQLHSPCVTSASLISEASAAVEVARDQMMVLAQRCGSRNTQWGRQKVDVQYWAQICTHMCVHTGSLFRLLALERRGREQLADLARSNNSQLLLVDCCTISHEHSHVIILPL